MSSTPRARVSIAVAMLALVSCRGGCRRGEPHPGALDGTLFGALALVPAEATLLARVDVAALRATSAWQRLANLGAANARDARLVEEFARRTGLHPLRQVTWLLVAFPEESRSSGKFGLIVRADALDEKRLVAYARDEAHREGRDLEMARRGARTLWREARPGGASAFFLDKQTLVIGAGGWTETMADLADAKPGVASVQSRPDLVHLAERVALAQASPDAASGGAPQAWAAAIVPSSVRQNLRAPDAGEQARAAASVLRMAAGATFGAGVDVDVVADMTNARDAQILADRLATLVQQAKRNPLVLLMGLGPHLDGVRAEASGTRFSAKVSIAGPALADLLGRLAAARGDRRPAPAPSAPPPP